jgi:uncharacterized membrane protein
MKKQLLVAGLAPAAVLVLILGAACSGEEESPPDIDCSLVHPVPTFAEVTGFTTVCTDCHSTTKTGQDRKKAPTSINFDDYASASAHARQAAIEVNSGSMPPKGAMHTLSEQEKTTLFDWTMCGAPQ